MRRDYLSVKEICERFPVPKSTVYEWIKKGRIQSTTIFGRICVKMSDLERAFNLDPELPKPEPISNKKPEMKRKGYLNVHELF